MRKSFLSFSPPFIGDQEINEVVDTLREGWITTGPKVKRFEEEFAAFVGSRSALALNSGTAAMHVALAALGVGPGDAVIRAPLNIVLLTMSPYLCVCSPQRAKLTNPQRLRKEEILTTSRGPVSGLHQPPPFVVGEWFQ